jgi:hypothetical protein
MVSQVTIRSMTVEKSVRGNRSKLLLSEGLSKMACWREVVTHACYQLLGRRRLEIQRLHFKASSAKT